jgi:hypothetical protein
MPPAAIPGSASFSNMSADGRPMSFDHWWIGFSADEAAYQAIKPDFTTAAASAVLSAESQTALAAWRRCPSDFEQAAATTDATAAKLNAFIWAFNLPGFREFAGHFVTQAGRFSELASEQTLFRMLSTARTTPVSIVWHALGHERAGLLPGHMGNLLLHASEVDDALEQTHRAYAGTSIQSLVQAASRYCGWDVSDDALRDVISFLPDGLAWARQRQRGFLALARPQI